MNLLRMSLLLAILAGLAASLFYVIFSTGEYYFGDYVSSSDQLALTSLRENFQRCVKSNGLGLQAEAKGVCRVSMKFPSDTVPKWKHPKTGELEGLSYDFNICETLILWEQIRNTSTILTREYIDALPNGWHDYAWRRINKGSLLYELTHITIAIFSRSLKLKVDFRCLYFLWQGNGSLRQCTAV